MLDRIDIHIEVPHVDYEKLGGELLGESNELIRKRIRAARDNQRNLFSNIRSKNPIVSNADMRVGDVR
jgi:magnesium chelatase family protein